MQDRFRYKLSSQRQPAPSHPPAAPTQPTPGVAKDTHRRSSFWRRWWWLPVLIIVFVLGIGWLGYGYITTKSELTKLSKSEGAKDQSDTQKLVGSISKYLQLPDEEPTLATVSDVDKLKGQEFFKNAKNGDKVLIFPEAGRALLYRPSTERVIEYSKVDLSNQGP